MIYGEHFKIAVYARPSRCKDSRCNTRRLRIPDVENVPCEKPLKLPYWFQHSSVEKHQILNITLFALDDVIFRIEVQILHGVRLPSSDFFLNTVNVTIVSPTRSKIPTEKEILLGREVKRKLSPHISWEENEILMQYIFTACLTPENTKKISPPLNLPPRFNEFEAGRVLVSANVSHENPTPTIKEPLADVTKTHRFWENPFISLNKAKEFTDIYFETFHGLTHSDHTRVHDYNMKSMMLPYLPFFSNCREFDSYIPLSHLIESKDCKLPKIDSVHNSKWWRRKYTALPHRDDIRAVGPFDFNQFFPVSDWCERQIFCSFEEDLSKQDITPRWFETDSGTTLFSVLRDPVSYFDYTGRKSSIPSINDGGGAKFISKTKTFEKFIPVKVIKNLKKMQHGEQDECSRLCYPRKISLDISYYQMNHTQKRIVEIKLIYDDFDKNATKTDYRLNVKFYPLNYQELIIKFAYSRGIFLLLFTLIGILTIFLAFLFWIIVRLTTQLRNPPKLRFKSMFWLIYPQAITGFVLGLMPAIFVTGCVRAVLIEGYFPELFGELEGKYNPVLSQETRQGRLGFSFIAMAVISIFEGSKLFVPKRESKREKEIEEKREKSSRKKSIWIPIEWRRSNLIICSIFASIILAAIIEFSFWRHFGRYIWEIIILLKVFNNIVGSAFDAQLGEALLSAPIMSAFGIVESIVTLSANDFVDFLLSYVVGFGFLILDRMYISPFQSDVIDWISIKLTRFAKASYQFTNNLFKKKEETEIFDILSINPSEEKGESVEPIIDSYGSYCLDTLSLLYVPYVIILLMIFRDDTEIPTLYNIKENDMEHYATFALLIIPFQIAADIYLHTSLELFHGWKIYDYLLYSKYRFLQRETLWKGMEDSLDECIDESLRTLDQMCFSSQFYLMTTMHVNGIVYMVLGIEIMARTNDYNLFTDPVMPTLLIFVLFMFFLVKQILLWMGWLLNVWVIRDDNKAWHIGIRDKEEGQTINLEQIKDSNQDMFEINKHITSNTFRYKFLRHNRNWLIDQLESNILTPRTLRHNRPHLMNQFAKILSTLNSDISSDSDCDGDVPNFPIPVLEPETRDILKRWLQQAQRRIKLKSVVQPLIYQNKGNYCERCLSKKNLHIELRTCIEEM